MRDLSKLTLADLEALAARMENAARTMREAMAIVSGNGVQQTMPMPQKSGEMRPVVLDTPERQEYNAQKAARAAEQRAYLETVRGVREAKLSQFAHDGGDDKDAPVSVETLERISGE